MNMARGMTTEARERAAWERNDREIRADISVWMSLTSKKVGDLAALVGISRATMYQRFKRKRHRSTMTSSIFTLNIRARFARFSMLGSFLPEIHS